MTHIQIRCMMNIIALVFTTTGQLRPPSTYMGCCQTSSSDLIQQTGRESQGWWFRRRGIHWFFPFFFPFDNTQERSTCSFRIVPWYRIIPYSCPGCADGTSGWCSSAPLGILSMPHNSGDFISTNGDLCRAAKALFPSPFLPKQMVSPRPCQTPHWTLFISKVLASCLFKMTTVRPIYP